MLFNTQLALHSLSYSTISDECYIHVMYSHSAVHRKNRDLNQTFKIVVKGILDETKILSPTVNMIEAMSIRWYLWQETILRDVYDSSPCYNFGVFPMFRKIKIDQKAFLKQYNLLECNPNIARTSSEKFFLFLYKHFFYMIPLYFLFKDIIFFVRK